MRPGSTTLLKVNIDHVATLREARKGSEPDPFLAARAAEDAGAAGITLHLRQDRRHVQESDLAALRAGVRTEINLEMAALPEMLEIARRHAPEQVTLVPERREEITTEGGLAVRSAADLTEVVGKLRALGMLTSLFIDPEPAEIEASASVGADAVELHTGRYANASRAAASSELDRLASCAEIAASAGLRVFAGHGLNYANVAAVVGIPQVTELNIGHSIVSRAIFVGFERAVREMLERVSSAPSR
jgi:pyridoxine 5-phosphate synthase